jgi:zinc/manganese transport system substrate-binding protein
MRVKTTAVALAVIAALALAGCSASTSPAGPTSSGGKISVVASTDVYGDIAKQIGGSRVSVDSIINDPSQDPHSYEADAQVQLALSKADVVIENGGGYDSFVGTLLKGADNSGATRLNVATISGHDLTPTTGEFNEHLWFDFPTITKLADQLAAKFTTLDASGAAIFSANAKKFDAAIAVLVGDEAALKAAHTGEGAAITEPVPLYLLDAAGLVDKTPAAFSRAIEQGTDVPPLVLRQTLALFTDHTVKLLAYNEQTSSPETTQVLAAAKAGGIPVVAVRETLPSGKDYLQWMSDVLAALKTALR